MCAFHCIWTDIYTSTSGNMPKRLDPRDIRFTHDSVDETFDDGRHLEDTLKELKDGTTDIETIPRITVVKKDGMIFSPNNRRLWVFKEYAKFLENKNKVLEVPVKFGTSDGLKSCDMTTANEGENVEVRPNGSEKYDRNIETVRLSDVLYSTDKLYRFSKSGGHYRRSTIDDEFDRFSSNVNETKLLPVLKVVKRKGHLYALDNLELWLLKQWHEKNPDDVLNGGENVRIELRPYRELTEIFTTTDEGRSIQIVWDEPKKDKGKKYKPLTRQKPSQERKDLVKYCQSYEDQSKRSSRR